MPSSSPPAMAFQSTVPRPKNSLSLLFFETIFFLLCVVNGTSKDARDTAASVRVTVVMELTFVPIGNADDSQ
ncbi:hypothetical protein AAY473_034764 [Plecturocebus cupreus]